MPRLRLACSLLILAAALPATAAADTDWKRVSSVGERPGGGQPLDLGRDGDAVVGTWTVRSNGTFVSLETVRLTPTRADEVAGLVTFRPTSAANWDFMDATPISGAAGTAQVLFTGQLNTNLNAPSGTNLAPLLPTGDLGPLVTIVPRTPDMLAGLDTPAGLLWAGNSGSTLYTFKQGSIRPSRSPAASSRAAAATTRGSASTRPGTSGWRSTPTPPAPWASGWGGSTPRRARPCPARS